MAAPALFFFRYTHVFSLARLALACLALALPPVSGHAATEATPAPDAGAPLPADAERAAAQLVQGLHYRQGEITLQGGAAKLNVPDAFHFLDPADTRKVLVDLWGNPPDAADKVLGMLLPADAGPDQPQCYGVIITYDGSGYVKDDDAEKIDYRAMLKDMQKATNENNEARTKKGYPAMELIGWAAPPHYDRATKKLYWAKEFEVEGNSVHTLNYDIRILGRRGVLILSAIAGMNQLDQIKEAAPQVLSMVNFQQGNRYADFDPKTDKVAAYGLAALVAGGILAKVGGFKLLIGLLLAAKKFVIIGLVAVSGFIKRLFGRGGTAVPADNNKPQALPPGGGTV